MDDEILFEPESEAGPPGVPGLEEPRVGVPGVPGHADPIGVDGPEEEPPAIVLSEPPEPELIHVRASAHLPGLSLGDEVWVDPADPYIVGALAGGFLARVEPAE